MAGLNCRAGYATDCIPHEGPWLEKFAQTTSLSDLTYLIPKILHQQTIPHWVHCKHLITNKSWSTWISLFFQIRSKWNRQRPHFTKLRMVFLTVILKSCSFTVTSRYFCRHCMQTKKISGSLLNHYQKFVTRWRPSMQFYSKWRRIFVRNRVGSISNSKIHHASLYVIKLPHSRNVVMKSKIVNHLKTINQN